PDEPAGGFVANRPHQGAGRNYPRPGGAVRQDQPAYAGRSSKRRSAYGAGSMCGFSPLSNSATSLPVAVAIDGPAMLCPAAISNLLAAGARPTPGNPP